MHRLRDAGPTDAYNDAWERVVLLLSAAYTTFPAIVVYYTRASARVDSEALWLA